MPSAIKTLVAIVFAIGIGAAVPASAETYQSETQKPSPVYSGIANALSGNTSSAKATDDKKAEPERKKTRAEYRAEREARKAAEETGDDIPLPKDVFFDKETGQWKKVVRYKSGGNYTIATTCYEVTHQSSNSRVFRPVGCIMNKSLRDD